MLKELGWEIVVGAVGTTLIGGITGWVAKGWLTPAALAPSPPTNEVKEGMDKAIVAFMSIAQSMEQQNKGLQELKALVQESINQRKGEAAC